MEDVKRGYLVHLLEFTKGNLERRRKRLEDIARTFYNILEKHDVNPEDFKRLNEKGKPQAA